MNINIRGDKMIVTPAIKSYVEERVGKLEKYFDNKDTTATVVLRVNKLAQIAEITIPLKNTILRAEESSKDLYESIVLAKEKIERQIRKNKTKLKKKVIAEGINLDFEEEEKDSEQKITKRKTVDMKPMSEDEAILQLELIDHDFYIFKNSVDNKVNVVYKKKDGNFGIIEVE
jgi:putative sigma-54 modulation protein